MFWNKKEDRKILPDLPESPQQFQPMQQSYDQSYDQEQYPPQMEEHIEKQKLPSFPDSPIQKGFSQAAIKDAINPSESNEEETTSPPIKDAKTIKTIEMDDWSSGNLPAPSPPIVRQLPKLEKIKITPQPTIPVQPSMPIVQESFIPSPPTEPYNSPLIRSTSKGSGKPSDIFVKLDKFVSARKALQDIQQKLEDVDELLKKIRETKLREEQELAIWEKEMASVKARVGEITQNVFEKIE